MEENPFADMEATSEATSDEALQLPDGVYGEYVMAHWEPELEGFLGFAAVVDFQFSILQHNFLWNTKEVDSVTAIIDWLGRPFD